MNACKLVCSNSQSLSLAQCLNTDSWHSLIGVYLDASGSLGHGQATTYQKQGNFTSNTIEIQGWAKGGQASLWTRSVTVPTPPKGCPAGPTTGTCSIALSQAKLDLVKGRSFTDTAVLRVNWNP